MPLNPTPIAAITPISTIRMINETAIAAGVTPPASVAQRGTALTRRTMARPVMPRRGTSERISPVVASLTFTRREGRGIGYHLGIPRCRGSVGVLTPLPDAEAVPIIDRATGLPVRRPEARFGTR